MTATHPGITLDEAKEQLKTKIENTFGELISPELWDRLVMECIQSFLAKDVDNLIKKKCEEFVLSIVQEELQKPEWQSEWKVENGVARNIAENVRKVMIDAAPAMLARILESQSQSIMALMRSQMQNTMAGFAVTNG